jgi:hypothetical protein
VKKTRVEDAFELRAHRYAASCPKTSRLGLQRACFSPEIYLQGRGLPYEMAFLRRACSPPQFSALTVTLLMKHIKRIQDSAAVIPEIHGIKAVQPPADDDELCTELNRYAPARTK